MKKRMIVGGGIAALIVAAGFGGMAIAGDGDEREAGPRIVAEPMTATKAGPVTRAGGAHDPDVLPLPGRRSARGRGHRRRPQVPEQRGQRDRRRRRNRARASW